MPERVLVDEDFSTFPIGYLPFLYTPHGEYHYMPPPGRLFPWYEATCSNWHLASTWMILEENGRHYLEHSYNHDKDIVDGSILVIGETGWRDYRVELDIRLLSARPSGCLLRYQTARRHIRVLLDGRRLLVAERDDEEVRVLAETAFEAGYDRRYALHVTVTGPRLVVQVDGKALLEVLELPLASGKAGVFAGGTSELYGFRVVMAEAAHAAFNVLRSQAARTEQEAREKTPQPLLLKRIGLHGRCAGRQLRIGDINGDGRKELVVARCQRRNMSDSHNHIRSLTAISLNGEILWDYGEPGRSANAVPFRSNHPDDPEIITCDLPFQVYDLDGDGCDEVLLYRHFQIIVLDGRSGSERLCVPTPWCPEGHEDDFRRLNVDAFCFADLTGRGRAQEVLIKNRYRDIWALDAGFNVLWQRSLNTGHFPAAYDLDGDGRDEIVVGYSALRHDGSSMFEVGIQRDHVDEIVIGRFGGAGAPVGIAVVAGNEGFMLWDLEGRVVHREMLGHAQRVSAAPYRPELAGAQFFTSTYWGEPGILSFHDSAGKRLWFREFPEGGLVICPVDWSAEAAPLCLLSGSRRCGGLMDGHGRLVAVFPDDGHPEMCADVADLLGTGRDQVLLWDDNALYVYGAADIGGGRNKLKRFPPEHNRSNYRGEGLFPV